MKLDSQQMEAVMSDSSRLLVIAGAGSGKTRVLTERIRRLVETDKVPPHNIVAITFTNLAADEMKERLDDIEGIGDAFIGTIHAFANKIYQTSGKEYIIMNDDIYHKAMYVILKQPGFEGLRYSKFMQYEDVRVKVERFEIPEEEEANFLLPTERDTLIRATTGSSSPLRSYCKRNNVITFDEMLEYATDYFQSLGAELEHLFIDELQDVGSLEYKFITTLNAKNYFLVGDDWQAIYGWKGGNVEIFKSLAEDPEYDKVFLSNNYRNAETIINVSLQVIEQIKDKIIPKLVSIGNKDDGTVTINRMSQMDKMIKLINNHNLVSGDSFSDWFVLARTNKQAYELATFFDSQSIPSLFVRKSDYTLKELESLMEKDSVKILTVHSSKGLENKNVILYGSFPIVQPSYRMKEEERKVMYVGCTRASHNLHIFN